MRKNFASFTPGFQEPCGPALDVVTTDMPTAIDLVIALERRDTGAGCVDNVGAVFDNFMGDPHDGTRMFIGESLGYTSGLIRGPSTSWTTDEYGAIDHPPFTESGPHFQTKKVLDYDVTQAKYKTPYWPKLSHNGAVLLNQDTSEHGSAHGDQNGAGLFVSKLLIMLE